MNLQKDLDALLAAATPAPWEYEATDPRENGGKCHALKMDGYYVWEELGDGVLSNEQIAADAALIVRLVNAFASGDLITREEADLIEARNEERPTREGKAAQLIRERDERIAELDAALDAACSYAEQASWSGDWSVGKDANEWRAHFLATANREEAPHD